MVHWVETGILSTERVAAEPDHPVERAKTMQFHELKGRRDVKKMIPFYNWGHFYVNGRFLRAK